MCRAVAALSVIALVAALVMIAANPFSRSVKDVTIGSSLRLAEHPNRK